MGWLRAYFDEGGKHMAFALDGIKIDFMWLANACQSKPVKALKYEQEEKSNLEDLIKRLEESKTLEQYINPRGVTDTARNSKKVAPNAGVKITSGEEKKDNKECYWFEATIDMLLTEKEKKHKDIIETVVKRVHGASKAAGMSFSKPRQVIDDMAVLYAQAMEINEVCTSK